MGGIGPPPLTSGPVLTEGFVHGVVTPGVVPHAQAEPGAAEGLLVHPEVAIGLLQGGQEPVVGEVAVVVRGELVVVEAVGLTLPMGLEPGVTAGSR